MVDFFNSKTGILNPHVLGPMSVIRANIGERLPCLTAVFDWPHAEDDAGVAFPSDIYGVRTSTSRQDLVDGGGDTDFLVAVPKSLPVGYTSALRHSILTAGFYADYLGADPMAGTTWNHRTPSGLLLNDTTDPDGIRRLWTPMNLNQQTLALTSPAASYYHLETAPLVTATYPPTSCNGFHGSTASSVLRSYHLLGQYPNHIGFRGGHFKLGFYTNSASFACGRYAAGEVEIKIGYCDPGGAFVSNLPATVVFSASYDQATTPSIGAGFGPDGVTHYTYRWEREVFLPAMESPLGLVKDWYVIETIHIAGDGPDSLDVFRLSPSVNVPLWYSASMGNRCAPGGIIPP